MRLLPVRVLLACIAACLVINAVMGKDMNADMLAYHVYSAHMFWTGGYREDFMGAGLQGFFNPLGYLPFYGLLKTGWHSLAVASCMAAIHAINLCFIWLIGRDHLFRETAHPPAFATLGTALAGASPVFLAVVGSSFLDPVQSAMLLGALYALMRGMGQPAGERGLLLAGLLMGAAAGLKPTVVTVPVIACFAMAITCRAEPLKDLLRHRLLPFGGAVVAGGLLTGGFWALHLWQRFGSPVFPFANDLFKSPDFFAVPLTTDRYSGEGLLDLLAFPFRMAKINSGIYVEIAAPDIRFALLLLLLAGLSALWLLRRWSRQSGADLSVSSPPDSAVLLLWIVFGAGVLLWMAKLGNGRYHLIYLLLAGPLLLWVLARCRDDRKGALMGGSLVLAAQIAHGFSMGYPRWDSVAWSDSWMKVSWPSGLETGPATYLQVGLGIDPMVVSEFPEGSRFVDLGGKFPVAPDSPLAQKINGIVSGSAHPRYVMFRRPVAEIGQARQIDDLSPDLRAQINHLLAPWNLHISGTQCHGAHIDFGHNNAPEATGGHPVQARKHYALFICRVTPGSMSPPEDEQVRRRLAQLSESLSSTCPLLFPRPASLPTQLAGVWNVRFIGTDTLLSLHQGHLTYSRYPYGPFNQPIEPDPSSGLPVVHCVAPGRAW